MSAVSESEFIHPVAITMEAEPRIPKIRRAEPHDARKLSALRAALFREIGQVLDDAEAPQFHSDCARAFAKSIEHGQCQAWLAEDASGAAVACLAMLVLPRLPTPTRRETIEGYLLNVYTQPEWRKRGVARALVAAAIVHARDHGFARIRLHATEAGRTVYSSQGFASRVDEMELKLGD